MNSPFKLIRYFSIASFFTIVMTAVVLALFYGQIERVDIISIAEQNNVSRTRSLVHHVWSTIEPFTQSVDGYSPEQLRNHPNSQFINDTVSRELDEHLHGDNAVIKVKIYNREGITIFSTDERDLGDSKGDSDGFTVSINGKVFSQHVHKDTFRAIQAELTNIDIIETYVPIRGGGPETPVEGIIEMYYNVTPLFMLMGRTQKLIFFAVIGLMGVVYGILLIIVWYGDRAIQQAERQVRQFQRHEALNVLTGGLTHELNNLLLPIAALTGMVLKNLPDDHSERGKLEKVIEASDRAKDIIEKVVTYSRMSEPKQKHVDIAVVVHDALNTVRVTTPTNVKLEEQIDNNSGIVHADEAQIVALLAILTSNAFDAIGMKPGEVKVSLYQRQVNARHAVLVQGIETGMYAMLSVSDTGNGIDPATLEHIYDPFFTTKEVGQGTGLGLSMVLAIVQQHGGAIVVSSEEGSGTTFNVYLPTEE